MTWGARRRLAGGWAMVPFALLLVWTQLGAQPPALLPTHWTGAYPDGFSEGGSVLFTALVVAGVSSILAAFVALVRVVVPGPWSRWVVALLAAVSGGAAAVYGVSVWATRQAGRPEDVHVLWALAAVLLALLSGLVAFRVHGRKVPLREDLLDGIPEQSRVVPVGASPGGDRAQPWTGRSVSRLLFGMSIYTAVIFAVCLGLLLYADQPWPALLVAVIGVPLTLWVLAWSQIAVVIDDRGLRVRSERFPVTLLSVTPDQVLGVEVIELDPMRWGGYGLRVVPGRTAYVVRGGDAVLVHRANGTRLALEMTEDEPRGGAAVLLRVAGQALAAARSGSAEG